jgi:hypothetical protein
VAGIHPERVIPGAQPGRGLVLTGPLTAVRPRGAGWEAELTVGGQRIACRLPDRPEPVSGSLTVTALNPPLFGTDGTAVPPPGAADRPDTGSVPGGSAMRTARPSNAGAPGMLGEASEMPDGRAGE